MRRTRVKICCISTTEEARAAIAAGADAIGLVGNMPSGPGPIPDERIREIAESAPPGVATFLLTSVTAPERVVSHARRCRTTVVQLVDAVDPAVYEALRDELPTLRIVQVVHVEDECATGMAAAAAAHVDALLLDSGRPRAEIRELGGTGRRHDWRISARIVKESAKPVFLAGGLRPDNVAAAIAEVSPYGLDLCTGVRTDGHLDGDKLASFFRSVRAAEVGGHH